MFAPPSSLLRRLLLPCSVLLAALSATLPPLLAQPAPGATLFDTPPTLAVREQPAVSATLSAADNALAAGLTTLAAELYEQVSLQSQSSPSLQEKARLGLASALLARNRFAEAAAILEQLPSRPEQQVRLAVSLLAQNRATEADALLKKISVGSLSSVDRAWYYAAQGMLGFLVGNHIAAGKAFDLAAQSFDPQNQQQQRQQMRLLEYVSAIRMGGASEEMVAELRKRILNEGTSAAFDHSKALAIALDQLKRPAQAAAELQRIPNLSPAQRDERDLLLGIILTPSTEEGRAALFSVIRNKAAPDLQRIALQCLTAAVENASGKDAMVRLANNVFAKLTEQATVAPDARTLDSLNLARARIMVLVGAWDKAESSANDLLEKNPESPLRADALRILASAAFQNRNYRRTADYLLQLQSLLPSAQQSQVGRIAADCLFLAGRYPAAAATYAAILPRISPPQERGATLFLQVLCELQSDNFAAAEQTVRATPNIDETSRLNCEWTLINWLREKGKTAEALVRVEQALTQLPQNHTTFRIRFLWQQALLSFNARQYAEVQRLADSLTGLLQNLPAAEETLLPNRAAMLSQTALLKARAVLAARQPEAETAMTALRLAYPREAATAASFLVEGRDRAARGEHAAARDLFLQPFKRLQADPTLAEFSEYAAQGLFEAAEQCALLGADGAGTQQYRQATQYFDRMVEHFPAHRLVAQARLRQADLFRIQGQFDDAMQVYETLLRNESVSSSTRWRAELGRSDCLFAKAMNREGSAQTTPAAAIPLERAITAYERLFALPNKPVDLTAEAGYKWGVSLQLREPNLGLSGNTAATIAKEAKDAHWLVINQLLLDPVEAEKLATGRWWITKSLFAVAEYYESIRNPEEARRVYQLLLDYNQKVQNTPQRALPGQEEARRKIASLPSGY